MSYGRLTKNASSTPKVTSVCHAAIAIAPTAICHASTAPLRVALALDDFIAKNGPQ